MSTNVYCIWYVYNQRAAEKIPFTTFGSNLKYIIYEYNAHEWREFIASSVLLNNYYYII